MNLYCANNNTIYPSVAAAADDLYIDRTTIHRFLHGERSTAANYVFAKIDDISADKLKKLRARLLYSAFHIVLEVDEEPIIYERSRKK